MFSKKLLGGAALTALSLAMGGGVANAQSTGSQEQETIVVTGGRHSINGAMIAETVAKERQTITAEQLSQNSAGQSFLQTVNVVPGVNFTNNDSYGSSGGNIRIHGFDGNRISLTWDGMPLNDSGNYAIFSNQLADAEIIDRVQVNIGSTDVDSPTASASGGTVNVITRRPLDHLGFQVNPSIGDYNYYRVGLDVDTGQFGPFDTTAFATGSYQNYDKWRGPGELQKRQYNARFYQPLSGSDFVAVSFHWNENRNNSYRNNLSQNQIRYYGWGYDNLPVCTRDAPTPGVADNDGATLVSTVASASEASTSTFNATGRYLATADNPANPSSCTNYYNVRINPGNTGNMRAQSRFSLGDHFVLTIDPSFQYVLANGGGFTTLRERDDRLDGAAGNTAGAGLDLNGDGDTLDTLGVYNPSNTNTRRYGVLSSLIWNMNENNRFRIAYTLDYARHRQTGEYELLDAFGNPDNVFGGKDGQGTSIAAFGGGPLQARNRFSIAKLNQLALEYSGYWLGGALQVNLGVRAPVFDRELNQKCFSENGTSFVLCTGATPTTTLANGNVQFIGGNTATTQYVTPYHATFQFKDTLPNAGLTYHINDENLVYVSYAESLSAPRTDNLYTPIRNVAGPISFTSVTPETSQTIDAGYRLNAGPIIASLGVWHTDFQNRIVTSFDDVLNVNVDRNVGSVTMKGVDLSLSAEIGDHFDVYAAASIMSSELQDDVALSATTALRTKGHELPETPDQTYSLHVNWEPIDNLSIGLEGKFVGRRAATDINDEISPSYTVWDLNARWDLSWAHAPHSYLQLNINNLTDEHYLGSISTTNNAQSTNVGLGGAFVNRAGSFPTYAQASPRVAQISLHTQF